MKELINASALLSVKIYASCFIDLSIILFLVIVIYNGFGICSLAKSYTLLGIVELHNTNYGF